MKGKELQKLIQDSGFSKREWAKKTGIPERTIGSLYNSDSVKQKYLSKFKAFGLIPQLGKSEQELKPNLSGNETSAELKDKLLKAYETIIELKSKLANPTDQLTEILAEHSRQLEQIAQDERSVLNLLQSNKGVFVKK